ncbi:hypothetical protein MTR_2g438670 [Medicago truncatula]|uniref:Uncharacterized protein n=1 Tax=Medicago truncatula TaxID=3880 RepID=A0A072VH03_MEDTR|nr:hypothetical protein MTR_2g438670 [Medicago truncatula]
MRAGSGRRCTRHDNERLPIAYRRTELHQNERDPEAVEVCIVEGTLIGIVWYYLYQQHTSSFWKPNPQELHN